MLRQNKKLDVLNNEKQLPRIHDTVTSGYVPAQNNLALTKVDVQISSQPPIVNLSVTWDLFKGTGQLDCSQCRYLRSYLIL